MFPEREKGKRFLHWREDDGVEHSPSAPDVNDDDDSIHVKEKGKALLDSFLFPLLTSLVSPTLLHFFPPFSSFIVLVVVMLFFSSTTSSLLRFVPLTIVSSKEQEEKKKNHHHYYHHHPYFYQYRCGFCFGFYSPD